MGQTRELFDPIARHYDGLSALLSVFGIRAWHRAALTALHLHHGLSVLDVGCGTGAVTRKMARLTGPGGHVVGLDPSSGMLGEAQRRTQRGGSRPVAWVTGSGEALPFPDASFDRITAHFSLRNMDDWQTGLREMTRVARPGARLEILDLVQPVTTRGAWAMRGLEVATRTLQFHRFDPYRWLGRSLLHAPTAAELVQTLHQLGWEIDVRRHWLGDLVTLLVTTPRALPSAVMPLAAGQPVRVVWATDGSQLAQHAVEWLLTYGPKNAVVDVVTVCPPIASRDRAALGKPDRRAWQQALDEGARQLQAHYPVATHLLDGPPGPVLLAYGKQTRPDLMLLGLKHREPGADRLLGSVAAYLLTHADWPVMAVPLAHDEPSGEPATGG